MQHLRHIILLLAVLLVSCKQEVYFNVTTNIQPAEGGSIVMNPSASQVLEGTSVSFTAQPKGEYVFSGWSGSFSGTENPKTVNVTSDLSVTAKFTLRNYPLTLSVEGEGNIIENVLSSKADYASGTVVELTAVPATGWSFDHWEGDLKGSNNPSKITASSAKSVKAVFTKNHYAYNLKIVGPGVVDEYLVENTKASLEYGARVLLKAFPAEGAVFKGWSGDLTGSDSEVFVDVDAAKDLTATFAKDVLVYPAQDLMQPSVRLKHLCPGLDFSAFTSNGNGFHPYDYNRDGFMDLIVFDVDWSEDSRYPVRFMLGNSEGDFIPDGKNDRRLIGLNNNRKTITGDYNKDGQPDFFLIGHGYDSPPFPGEYLVAFLSQSDGTYQDSRYTECVSFYHGGSSADYDNDGDLDIVLVDGGAGNELILLNDGAGLFTGREDLLNHSLLNGMYTAEFYDIDNDGYIDLITGLDDFLKTGDETPDDYNNTTIVFWGNGEHYNGNYTRLPKLSYKGMGIVLDYDFFDIDEDGKDEIILARTGDPVFGKDYQGWAIQIIKCDGRSFIDITDDVIKTDESKFEDEQPVIWIHFEDYKGETYLVGRQNANARLLYKYSNGKLMLEYNTQKEVFSPRHGFTLLPGEMSFENWKQWDGHFFSFNEQIENGADLSYLKDNGYALEFFIKNEDPSLRIDIKFESFIDQETWKLATYFYGYDASEHPMEATWERVVVPLDKLDDWTDKAQNYWTMLDHVHFQISSTGAQPFSFKDIRIRKVLPE